MSGNNEILPASLNTLVGGQLRNSQCSRDGHCMAITIRSRVPQKPRVPTANPKRRKSIAPRMVETAVK